MSSVENVTSQMHQPERASVNVIINNPLLYVNFSINNLLLNDANKIINLAVEMGYDVNVAFMAPYKDEEEN